MERIQNVLNKVSKTIGLLPKYQKILPRHPSITIYKSLIRPHLDYGDIVYDQAYNVSFHQKLESIQYSTALVITEGIKVTSREKLYHELGFESLESRRCGIVSFVAFIKFLRLSHLGIYSTLCLQTLLEMMISYLISK